MAAIFQTTFSNSFSGIKYKNCSILVLVSIKFVAKGTINNMPALILNDLELCFAFLLFFTLLKGANILFEHAV